LRPIDGAATGKKVRSPSKRHPKKHSLPTDLTFSGIVSSVNLEQLVNALAPIAVTLSGISNSGSFEHPLNVFPGIVVVPSAKETDVKRVQFVNT
jgi:hypothetical protein